MTDHEPIPAPENFLDQGPAFVDIPAYWYTDSKIFGKEKEQIFYKNWWYVGAPSVTKPGEFLTTTVVDQEFSHRGGNVLGFLPGEISGAPGGKGIEKFNHQKFGLVSVRVETLIGFGFFKTRRQPMH
ncbi:MAG: hypothetical protein Ct9H300mP14_05950 [Gammaproteobacteria bacterium]|nr:MAG: hypothetical protein Ct9H300mP14_05950 [Gammaproteobacteria bacterium]